MKEIFKMKSKRIPYSKQAKDQRNRRILQRHRKKRTHIDRIRIDRAVELGVRKKFSAFRSGNTYESPYIRSRYLQELILQLTIQNKFKFDWI